MAKAKAKKKTTKKKAAARKTAAKPSPKSIAKDWFSVDREGLAQLLERRGRAFAVIELIQNAWDADDVSKVEITLVGIRTGVWRLEIIDDSPDGFADLTHAWTLFAKSIRKDKAEKRGRFNAGEKMVLALVIWAQIATTTGTVIFNENGRRRTRSKTEKGSRFTAEIELTEDDVAQIEVLVGSLIPPVPTFFNGDKVDVATPVREFEAILPTEIADADGNMRRTKRKTAVRIFERWDKDQPPSLYEMGIPVVPIENRFHVEVMQKIPLNMERDNTTPGFLREINALVLNETHDLLEEEDVVRPWAREAASSPKCSDEAITTVLDKRYGEDRVSFDPSDLEANKIATAKGMTVVTSNSMTKGEWDNAKRAGAIKPAGEVTPSPKVLCGKNDGDELKDEDLSKSMRVVKLYAEDIGDALLGFRPTTKIARANNAFQAWYGMQTLTFNLQRLGHRFFDDALSGFGHQGLLKVNELLIHEFAHEEVSDHLSEEFHDECCRLGAKLALLALRQPDLFDLNRLKVLA